MRRAQITIFLIVGIALVLVFAGLFIFLGPAEQIETEADITRTQQEIRISSEITTQVSKCLDILTEEAVQMIARQGGYIYDYQGGQIAPGMYFRVEGTEPIPELINTYQNHTYLINDILIPPAGRGQKAPQYPCIMLEAGVTGDCRFSTTESPKGYFGTTRVPPLYKYQENPIQQYSIQRQLEDYVKGKMTDCINISLYNATTGEMNLTISINERNVEAELTYPITVITPIRRKTEIIKYTAHTNSRLKKLYNFAKSIILKDVSDITFDMEFQSVVDEYYQPEFSMEIKKNFRKFDDLIIINDTDENSRNTIFQFIRQNRRPALNYIADLDNEFSELITIRPTANDPDEDKLIYEYEGDFSTQFMRSSVFRETEQTALINSTLFLQQNASVTIDGVTIVKASDGTLQDYQPVGIRISP
jgi:hypothetical protein